MRFNLSDEISIEIKTIFGKTLIEIWSEFEDKGILKHKLILLDTEEWDNFVKLCPLIDEYVKKEDESIK